MLVLLAVMPDSITGSWLVMVLSCWNTVGGDVPQECLVRTSLDSGLDNLLAIVSYLQAQAAETPRDHYKIFRVCSGGLEPERTMPGNGTIASLSMRE